MFKLLKDHDLPEPHFIIFPDDPIEPIVTILENLGLGSDETIHLENGKNVHTIDGFTLVIYYEI